MIKDALKYLEPNACVPIDMATTIMLVNALKEALAQPEQEPVAWQFMNGSSFRKRRPDDFSDLASDGLPYWRPLYTTPPQRKPLTNDELADLWYKQSLDWMEFARAIEATHGIKENT